MSVIPRDTLTAWQTGVCRYTLSNSQVWVVSGPDAASFLQGQTTQDVAALAVGSGAMAAILTPKGRVLFVLTLLRVEADTFWLVLPESGLSALEAKLTQAHFTEKLTMARLDTPWHFETLQGLYASALFRSITPFLAAHHGVGFSWPHPDGTGYWVALPKAQIEEYQRQLASWDLPSIAIETWKDVDWDRWTVATGFTQWPLDVTDEMILSETPLEALTVSPTKGCYVGQEVITRIRNQGRPPRTWRGLKLRGNIALASVGTSLNRGNTCIGTLGRGMYLPERDETWALVLIQRGVINSTGDEAFGWDGHQTVLGQLSALPLIASLDTTRESQQRYESAITLVTQHQEDEAIALLTQALALNPYHADATEVLGVLYSQSGQVEKAIDLMTQLATLDPTSVMAHTNLSRFYLMLGDKDRAETEKAQATVLQFQQAMKGHKTSPTQPSAEEARKIAMFQDVLALDPVDPLANYSLGNLYALQGNNAEAVGYLQQAIESDPHYSVAYLALGKAHEALNQTQMALDVFTRGAVVAQKQGDWMPLQAMEARLAALRAQPSA